MHDLYSTIYTLCESKKIKPGKLCAELGFSRSTMSDLKMGRKKTLSADYLSKIANYFGVSVDFILNGGTSSESVSHLEPGVHVYKSVTPSGFDPMVMEQIDSEIEEIVYQNLSVVITKDVSATIPQEALDKIIDTYRTSESSAADEKIPHEKYREVLAEGGIRLLLDADAKIPQEHIDDIVEFIKFKQRKNDR